MAIVRLTKIVDNPVSRPDRSQNLFFYFRLAHDQ